MSSIVGSSRRARVGYYGPTPKYDSVPVFGMEGVLRVDRRSETVELIPVDKNGKPIQGNVLDLEGEFRAKGVGKHEVEIAVAKLGKLQTMSPSYRRGEVKAEVMQGLLTDIQGHFYIRGHTLAVAMRRYNGKRVQIEVMHRVRQPEGSSTPAASSPQPEDRPKPKTPKAKGQPGPVVVDKVEF